MKIPACSILLPSRFRFDRLLKCVDSIHAAATGRDFEIIIRLHDDDESSLSRIPELTDNYGTVRIITGKTLLAYSSLDSFYDECQVAAVSDRRWLINDDSVIEGTGWDEKLALIPADHIVHCGIHGIALGRHHNDANSAAPIFNSSVLGRIAGTNLFKGAGPPVDVYLSGHYAKAGLPTSFLEGITYWHQWDDHAHDLWTT